MARHEAASVLALFTSAGTLVCCALPAALVALGLGGALASLASAAPWLGALTAHKGWIFGGAGALLAAATVLHVRSGRHAAACAKGDACARAHRWGRVILGLAFAAFAVGAFFAYAALPLARWLDG